MFVLSEKCESYGIRGETFRQLLAEIQPTCSNERSRACLCYAVLDSENSMGLFCIIRETLIKSNSPRSNEHTHAAEFDTLRFNQRIPRFDQL